MLFKRLKVSGLLSFGPTGIDLEMKPLNVLIGPNGSGKSNLLEVFSLLRATPGDPNTALRPNESAAAWFWKGPGTPAAGRIEATLNHWETAAWDARHILALRAVSHRFDVLEERVQSIEEYADLGKVDPADYYLFDSERAVAWEEPHLGHRVLAAGTVTSARSILAQLQDPERYPFLAHLDANYSSVQLHRNWSFGPSAPNREAARADDRSDRLRDGGANLALMVSNLPRGARKQLDESIRELIAGAEGVDVHTRAGVVELFLNEGDGHEVPATRLSDGTLRYLCLLAILLNPEPPPFVAIEEPELGLHPDIIPHIAKLLIEASQRMQLVVTTHSRLLVDCLSETPESIVVCERVNGESHFERLDPAVMKHWLDKYSLGEMWSDGVIGGNRW